MQRTPYVGDGDIQIVNELILRHLLEEKGYIVVSQTTRGRGMSEGNAMVFHSDGWGDISDAQSTIQWIIGQDTLCNGKIGLFGASAPGITQYLAAGTLHPT